MLSPNLSGRVIGSRHAPRPRVVAGSLVDLRADLAALGVRPGNNTWPISVFTDVSGNGNHGNLQTFAYAGGSGWGGASVPGSPSALTFDGTSDFVSLPDLGAAEDGDFTYEAWVNTSGAVINSIISEIGGATCYVVLRTTAAGIPSLQMVPDAGGGTTKSHTVAVNDGQWHHVAATCNGTNTYVYVDGVPSSQGSKPAGTYTLTATSLGKRSTSFYGGSIAAARIYPRALSAAEIKRNFRAGYLSSVSPPLDPSGQICLRYDDGWAADWSTVFPLLQERGLVASFAVVRSFIDVAGRLSLAQCRSIQNAGMEIECHSRTHGADPVNPAAFEDETVTAAEEMRALDLNVRSFQFPGTWLTAWPAGYYVTDNTFYGSDEELLLRANFEAYEAAVSASPPWALPLSETHRWGQRNSTVDTGTLAAAQAKVDAVRSSRKATRFLCHSGLLGQEGHMSVADYTTLLDYIVAARDEGSLRVVGATDMAVLG